MLCRLIAFLACFAFPAFAQLSGLEQATEVTIDRGAWGRLASFSTNEWLAVLTRFSKTEPSRLTLCRSTNLCRSWRFLSELREPGRKLDNGHLLLLPNGAVLLTGRSLIDNQSYRLPLYRSDDRGQTWKNISLIDSSETPTGGHRRPCQGLWEPFLFLLPDRKLSVIYSSEKHHGYSQVLSQKVSHDAGHTWGPEHRIVEQPNGGNLRPGMGIIARLPDARYIMVYEVVGLGRGEVHYKISPDGTTWGPGLGTPIPGHEAAPYVLVLGQGHLVLTSCSNTISTSDDAGNTWHPVKAPFSSAFKYTWPALYQLRPGELALSLSSAGAVKLHFLRMDTPP